MTLTKKKHTPLLLPKRCWEIIFNPMVGHMEYEEKHTGVCPARTITCRTHTSVNQPAIPEAPFHPLPSMEILFERTYLGPFHWSAYGYNLVLVLMDYGMQWFFMSSPESASQNRGTLFMSRTLHELYKLLAIKSVWTTQRMINCCSSWTRLPSSWPVSSLAKSKI